MVNWVWPGAEGARNDEGCKRCAFGRRQDTGGIMENWCRNLVCTDMSCEVSDASEDILSLYPDASQAVIDLMKAKVDPALVDKYVETAKSVK